jgi:hypothetical protein
MRQETAWRIWMNENAAPRNASMHEVQFLTVHLGADPAAPSSILYIGECMDPKTDMADPLALALPPYEPRYALKDPLDFAKRHKDVSYKLWNFQWKPDREGVIWVWHTQKWPFEEEGYAYDVGDDREPDPGTDEPEDMTGASEDYE